MASISLCVVFGLFLILNIENAGADKYLIVDSDGGADDAAALLQILKEPSVTLLAVTCVYGNVELQQACDNIRRTLELEDMADEVPVFPGASKPTVGTAAYDGYFGPDGFGNSSQLFPLPDINAKSEHAALAISTYATLYPGQITLISLGPLTNLALAVQIDPTLPSKLQRLIMMAGSSVAIGNISPVAEFNVNDDPIAAQVVIDSYPSGCHVSIMPFDICSGYGASWEWYNDWISTNTAEAYFISKIFQISVNTSRAVNETFQPCDLFATTVALYPQVVNSTDNDYVQVEICGAITKGEMVVDYRNQPAKPPNVQFYTALNQDVMLDLWDTITGSDNSTTTDSSTNDTSTKSFLL
ncbi:hypothetical protein CHUAL_013827 [Chamberlinius hualienensis]